MGNPTRNTHLRVVSYEETDVNLAKGSSKLSAGDIIDAGSAFQSLIRPSQGFWGTGE